MNMKINRLLHLTALGILILLFAIRSNHLGDLAPAVLLTLIIFFVVFMSAHEKVLNFSSENYICRGVFTIFSWLTLALIAYFSRGMLSPMSPEAASVPGPGWILVFAFAGILILPIFLLAVLPPFFVKKK